MEDKKIHEFIVKLAKKSLKHDNVPVGAIVVKDGKIISKGYNTRHSKKNVLGHAEIVAIQKAQKKIKDWRLYECIMYVTLQPCKMCEKIIREARISKVYYLVEKTMEKDDYRHTKFEILPLDDGNNAKKYSELLTLFFAGKRR